jgi:hypothetical protein
LELVALKRNTIYDGSQSKRVKVSEVKTWSKT